MTTLAANATNRAKPNIAIGNHWIPFAIAPLVFGPAWVALLGTPERFTCSLAGFVLIALLLVATATDLLWRKIPNWATYPAFLWGLGINVTGYFLPDQTQWLGSVGLVQSLTGGFGVLLIMFVIFSISGGGAGDVKLSACLGVLMGLELALDALLYTFVVGGAGMLCYSIWRDGPLFMVTSLFRAVFHWLLPTIVAPPKERQTVLLKKKFPLAPFFTCGAILSLYINQQLA